MNVVVQCNVNTFVVYCMQTESLFDELGTPTVSVVTRCKFLTVCTCHSYGPVRLAVRLLHAGIVTKPTTVGF